MDKNMPIMVLFSLKKMVSWFGGGTKGEV